MCSVAVQYCASHWSSLLHVFPWAIVFYVYYDCSSSRSTDNFNHKSCLHLCMICICMSDSFLQKQVFSIFLLYCTVVVKISFIKICQIGAHIVKALWKRYTLCQWILILWNSCHSDYCTPKIGPDHSLEVSRPAAVTVTRRMMIGPAEQNGALTSWQGYPWILKAAYLVY